MKMILAALAIAVPLVACAANDNLPSLTPQEVKARLGGKNFFVFDNNAPEVFKDGHVPGARWLHPSEYDPKELPADKSATLVFYCHNEH